MNASQSVTATFDPVLTVTFAGSGSGTVMGAGIDCSSTGSPNDCTEAYPTDTEVTLTASEDPGSTFGGWSGCTDLLTTPPTCAVTMSSPKSLTARFDQGGGGS